MSVVYLLLFFCNFCNLDPLGLTKSVPTRCAKNLTSVVELVMEVMVSKVYFESEVRAVFLKRNLCFCKVVLTTEESKKKVPVQLKTVTS